MLVQVADAEFGPSFMTENMGSSIKVNIKVLLSGYAFSSPKD